MEIFSERPRAFKMDRKSPFALSLKSSISQKLVNFLGHYTDDILAEYIIVLVCNGKHQVQATKDLEAFLGKRSGEFVSWLWDHLLKSVHASDSDIGLLDDKDANITNRSNAVGERNLKSSRSKDVQTHGNGNSDSSVGKKGKHRHPFANDSTPVPSTNVELPADYKHGAIPDASLKGVNSDKIQLSRQNTISSKIDGTDPLTHKPSRVGASSLIAMKKEQSLQNLDNSKKIVNSKGNGLPSSQREVLYDGLQSSITDGARTGQTCMAIGSARSLSERIDKKPVQSNLPRVSVWDRLGKPREDDHPVCDKTTDAQAVGMVGKDTRLFNQDRLLVTAVPGDCKKVEQSENKISKLNAASNIGRKRHFGEIAYGPTSSSVNMVSRNEMDRQCKEGQYGFKRLNSTSKVASPSQVTQVLSVKEKLHQIELEISRLRTKQLQVKKDGLSDSGAVECPKEDLESRTVFVTNVHFAANKEALSLYFSKCGMVLNVAILTDASNGQPKGSAYIVFAKKESVDKAVALSGTSFFSRSLKVMRKAEEASFNSIVPQRFGKPPRPPPFPLPPSNRTTGADKPPLHPSPHLQWRRQPPPLSTSAPPQPSAAAQHKKLAVSTAATLPPATTTQDSEPVSTASLPSAQDGGKPVPPQLSATMTITHDENPVPTAYQEGKIEDLAGSQQ